MHPSGDLNAWQFPYVWFTVSVFLQHAGQPDSINIMCLDHDRCWNAMPMWQTPQTTWAPAAVASVQNGQYMLTPRIKSVGSYPRDPMVLELVDYDKMTADQMSSINWPGWNNGVTAESVVGVAETNFLREAKYHRETHMYQRGTWQPDVPYPP